MDILKTCPKCLSDYWAAHIHTCDPHRVFWVERHTLGAAVEYCVCPDGVCSDVDFQIIDNHVRRFCRKGLATRKDFEPVRRFQFAAIPWRSMGIKFEPRYYQVRVEEESIIRTVTFRLPSAVQIHTWQSLWHRPRTVHSLYTALKVHADNEPVDYPFKQIEFERVTLESLFNHALRVEIE